MDAVLDRRFIFAGSGKRKSTILDSITTILFTAYVMSLTHISFIYLPIEPKSQNQYEQKLLIFYLTKPFQVAQMDQSANDDYDDSGKSNKNNSYLLVLITIAHDVIFSFHSV